MPDRDANDPTDARVAALLRSLDAEAAVSPVGGRQTQRAFGDASADVERLTAHLCGASDESLLEAASRDVDLRAVLVDVVDSLGLVEAGPFGAERAISGDVLGRAIAVFDSDVRAADRAVPVRGAAARVRALVDDVRPPDGIGMVDRAGRRSFWTSAWTKAAAAVLLVATSIGVLSPLGGRTVEAGPLLAVEGIERLARDGALSAEGPQTLHVGDRVTVVDGERWSVRLTGGARVIVGARDLLRVTCDRDGTHECGRAVLELDAGEALIDAGLFGSGGTGADSRDSSAPVLLLPDGGRLQIVAGAVHVALTGPISASPSAAVALRADARVRWTPRGATDAREFVGPSLRLLRGTDATGSADSADPSVSDRSKDAASLFRDLDFFGGARASDRPDRRVPALAWRVLDTIGAGDASARPSDDGGAPARRFDLAAGQAVRLAWDADAAVVEARSLRVLLRVRPASADSSGAAPLDTAPAAIRVALMTTAQAEGVADAVGVLEPLTSSERPLDGSRTLVLSLPASFAATRVGVPITLVLRAERAAAVVWFEGAAFSYAKATARGDSVPGSSAPK
jgi:hypothetical protein